MYVSPDCGHHSVSLRTGKYVASVYLSVGLDYGEPLCVFA